MLNNIIIHIKRLDLNALVTLYDPDKKQRFITTMKRDVKKDDPRIIRLKHHFQHIPYGGAA